MLPVRRKTHRRCTGGPGGKGVVRSRQIEGLLLYMRRAAEMPRSFAINLSPVVTEFE